MQFSDRWVRAKVSLKGSECVIQGEMFVRSVLLARVSFVKLSIWEERCVRNSSSPTWKPLQGLAMGTMLSQKVLLMFKHDWNTRLQIWHHFQEQILQVLLGNTQQCSRTLCVCRGDSSLFLSFHPRRTGPPSHCMKTSALQCSKIYSSPPTSKGKVLLSSPRGARDVFPALIPT